MGDASDAVSRWLSRVAGALLAMAVGLAVLEVGLWLAFGTAWPELIEIQGLVMVWFGLLGAAWGVESGFHLGVEWLVARLPTVWRARAERLASALVALFGGLLAVKGWQLVRVVGNTLPATGWPASWQYVPAVAAGIAIAWSGARRLVASPEVAADG